MSKPFSRRKMSIGLMSSAEASPAKTSVWPVAPGVPMVSMASDLDWFGSICESLAFYDHDTLSWKTRQRSLFGGLIEFSESWPKSGMIRSGELFQLRHSVTLTTGVGYWLLPTPVARDWKGPTPRSSSTICIPDLLCGYPHPELYEDLMGFPIGWTELEALETLSSHRSLSGSAEG